MAKRLGVKQVITLIGKRAYVDLMHDSPSIDVVISPQQVATSMLLSHVRRADIARVHSLRRGAAEAIEVVAHGTKESSKVVGRRICDIYLPSGTTIGAIVRDKDVLIAHDEVMVQADDPCNSVCCRQEADKVYRKIISSRTETLLVLRTKCCCQ